MHIPSVKEGAIKRMLKEEKTHRLYKMMKAMSMLKVRRVLSSYYMQDSPLVT